MNSRNPPLIQLRFEFPKSGPRPTRDMVEEAGRDWIKTGKTKNGIRITPICWSKNGPKNVRQWLARRKDTIFGCPGIVKQYALPGLTMCDYDTSRPPALRRFWRLARTLGLRAAWVEYNRTRRGWHVLVMWNRILSPAETVAIQSILGSDQRREAFNLSRVLSGKADSNERWNLLFQFKLK